MKREVIADGLSVDGRHFELVELSHDREIPGLGTKSFAVDLAAEGDLGAISVGFVSEREARRYLTTYGDVECTAVDTNHEKVKITRFGLGVPSGLFRNRREVTQDTDEVPSETPQDYDDTPSRRGRNAGTGAAPVSGADANANASTPAGGSTQTTTPVNNAPTRSSSGS